MLKLLTGAMVVALAGCGYFASAPPSQPQLRQADTCIFAKRQGLALMCCLEPSGRQKCFLVSGGFDI